MGMGMLMGYTKLTVKNAKKTKRDNDAFRMN
jgi:hypothetical protein